MTKIHMTSDEIRAHRPDPAMITKLRAQQEHNKSDDHNKSSDETVFRIKEAVRRRIFRGEYQAGDIAAFRAAFRSVSQARFAEALGISVDTLQNWEQGRREPDGPAKALLRLLARHPSLLMHDLIPTHASD